MENWDLPFTNILQEDSDLFVLSDAKLLTEDGYTFDIHKIVLARKSTYFRALFCGISKDKDEFLIPGVKGKCLSEILYSIYSENVTLTEENIIDLLISADYLLFDDIHKTIKERIKDFITVDNCMEFLMSSDFINDKDIFRESFRFIQINFEAVVLKQKHKMADLPVEVLKAFLRNKSLNITSERTAWLVIVEWVEKQLCERMVHVPLLIRSLGWGELDESLSSEIMEHKIIVDNPYIKKLNNMVHEKELSSNTERFKRLVANNLNLEIGVYNYRIPPRLHVVAEFDVQHKHGVQIYITYDENLDLWHKIAEMAFIPYYFISVGSKVYIFDCIGCKCLSIDLITKEMIPMNSFRRNTYHFCALLVGRCIYVLTEFFEEDTMSCNIEIYDTETDSWSHGTSLSNVIANQGIGVGKYIYVVGYKANTNYMTAHAFDTESKRWKRLPSPKIFRHNLLFFAYHGKLFIVGGFNGIADVRSIEIFDIAASEWRELEDLPFEYSTLHVTNINDRIFVYDYYYEINSKIVRWNHELQSWEKLEVKVPRQISNSSRSPGDESDVNFHVFCTVRHAETILMLSKEMKNQSLSFERSHFCRKNTFGQDWFTK